MPTTRERILEILKNKGSSSAGELSRALKMTAANIRHHMTVLIKEGSVVVIVQRTPSNRGRPILRYILAQQAHRHNLDRLASAILDTLIASLPSEKRNEALQRVASHLASQETPRRTTTLTPRLTDAVKRLNDMGYQSRWEAHSEAPRLVLGHCPYAAILPEHPELCQLDASLIENLLGVPARQVRKLAQDSSGGRYCLFIAGISKG